MSPPKRVVIASALLFLMATPFFPQTISGDIVGAVSDPSGLAISGAELVLTNTATNVSTTARSGADGRYIFSRLLPGTYELTASVSGFKRFIASNVKLQVGSRTTVDIQMTVGEVTTSVEVTAAAKLVQADDVVVGQVITERAIQALPLNGRNFIQLAQLSPGVQQPSTYNSAATSWTGRSNGSVIVAGLRENDSSYLLDGVETRSPRWGNTGFQPSVDAIQEFNVQRNAFPADQGWGTTVVNTFLRSGTNAYHGSVFEFIRNNKLDARNFFDQGKRPPYHQNQFGHTFGGPIIKNRVFFFTNYEGYRQRLGRTSYGIVPTANEVQGKFAKPIKDPLTGDFFPNNAIPVSRFDAVTKNVLTYYPAANLTSDPTWNYARAISNNTDSNQFHVKTDLSLSSTDTMFVRFSWLDSPLLTPSLFPGYGISRPLGDINAVISETHTFGPRLVNEFRLGYNRDKNFNVAEGAYGPDLAKQIGLKNTNPNPANFALPIFSPLNYSSIGQGFTATLATVDQLFQLNDTLSFHSGKHDIKMGTDIRRDRLAFTGDYPSNPSFSFNASYTGNGFADFLLGFPNFYQASQGSSASNFRTTGVSLFVEDNFKITPKLTLSIGLRYELMPPFSERDGKQGYFDFSTKKVITVKDGARDTLQPIEYNDFLPRFGFAYNPLARTVIRGGFGMYYDLISANESQFRGVLMPPNFQIIQANNTLPTPTIQVQDLLPVLPFGQTNSPNTTVVSDRRPYVYQYNMNVQQDYRGVLVDIGYVGSTGIRLNRRFNNNLAPPGITSVNDRRPFQGFSDILTSQNDGWSNYNGLNVKVERRFSKGLLLLGAYTFGKALDIDGPDEYAHRDLSGAMKNLRGPAQLDSRQRLVLSYSYELPIGKGKRLLSNSPAIVAAIVGGWQVTGITSFVAGQPLTPSMGTDWANIGARRLQPANRLGPGNSSDLSSAIRDHAVLFPYFQVTDFAIPAYGTLGNGGRNTIVGPGVNNFDFGFVKNTKVFERITTQFRAELFNGFNHAQFAGLDANINSPNFGRITSAREARDIQFGLKIQF